MAAPSRTRLALAWPILLLVGCLQPPDATPVDEATPEWPRIAKDGLVATGTTALTWTGAPLGAGASDTFEFSYDSGPAPIKGALEVTIRWSAEDNGAFRLAVRGPDGRVAAARSGTGWFAHVSLIDTPVTGTYKATVTRSGPAPQTVAAEGAHQMVIQFEAAPVYDGPVRDLLPNLITMGPIDVGVNDPGTGFGIVPASVKGCSIDEVAEGGARRCLRLSNAVGNVGEGPLQVKLAIPDGVLSAAGQGFWVQRIYRSDGSFHDEKVGPAVFHATHSHFHYAGLAHFTLHRYDLDSQERGQEVGKGRKSGFCFFDIGLVSLDFVGTVPPGYDGNGCLDPREQQAWFMGISPGWFDFYEWRLPDQYVDITGVPDGVYELVSKADGPGLLHESDDEDNEASVVLRLTGDKVDVLSTKGRPATLV